MWSQVYGQRQGGFWATTVVCERATNLLLIVCGPLATHKSHGRGLDVDLGNWVGNWSGHCGLRASGVRCVAELLGQGLTRRRGANTAHTQMRRRTHESTHTNTHKHELAGRRLPASLEQLEEERLDNVYDKAGFLSFMEFGGFDLRQDGAY